MNDEAFLAQYEAATRDAGVRPLENWSTLRITGRDRVTFLHNMCTNEVRRLAPGDHTEAFLTDVKGKLVGHVLVLAETDALVLLTAPQQAARLIPHLDRYIITEDVQMGDRTDEVSWWLMVGPQASNAIEAFGGEIASARCDWIWPGGRLVGTYRAKPQAAVGGCVLIGDAAWQALRIESGWPLFGVDFDDSNLAQEAGRNAHAINFKKGCYLGQETIARIDALGHVNKQLATVVFAGEDPPAAGTELTAGGQLVGHVTSSCWSPALGAPLALAVLRRGFFEPGAKLQCGGIAGEVIAMPAVTFGDPRRLAGG